jgi:invasion protein IalB
MRIFGTLPAKAGVVVVASLLTGATAVAQQRTLAPGELRDYGEWSAQCLPNPGAKATCLIHTPMYDKGTRQRDRAGRVMVNWTGTIWRVAIFLADITDPTQIEMHVTGHGVVRLDSCVRQGCHITLTSDMAALPHLRSGSAMTIKVAGSERTFIASLQGFAEATDALRTEFD